MDTGAATDGKKEGSELKTTGIRFSSEVEFQIFGSSDHDLGAGRENGGNSANKTNGASEKKMLGSQLSKHRERRPSHTTVHSKGVVHKKAAAEDDSKRQLLHEPKDKRFGARRESVAPVSMGGSRPEWFEDLNDTQISVFREVFELLDRDGGGSLDAEEVFTLMKDMDIDVTLDEIRSVLFELDSDGNGEIDFDEFLYAMSETDRYLDLLSSEDVDPDIARTYREKYSKRQTLFFTAITNFAIKNSLGMERYYASKVRTAPHVISCYTAGARLIGLNDRQLEQQLRKMQKAAKNQKSPYAKPLPFVTVKRKKPVKKKADWGSGAQDSSGDGTRRTSKGLGVQNSTLDGTRRTSKGLSVHDSTPDGTRRTSEGLSVHDSTLGGTRRTSEGLGAQFSSVDGTRRASSQTHDDKEKSTNGESVDDCDTESSNSSEKISTPASGGRRRTVMPDSINIQLLSTLQKLAENGSVVARIPDIHLVPQIRNKLESQMDDIQLCSSVRKSRRNIEQSVTNMTLRSGTSNKKTGRRTSSKQHGWVMPRRECGQAPLPLIKVNPKSKCFTIEDVAGIRKRVSSALAGYYSTLAQNHVKTAWAHWDQLHTDDIRSDRLRDQFRRTYKAYSPHKEGEVFTICPWMPGPRYTSRQPSKSGTAALSFPRRPASQPPTDTIRLFPPSRPSTSCGRSACSSPFQRPPSRPQSTV